MLLKSLIKNSILCMGFIVNCTFGSIDNSLSEKTVLWNFLFNYNNTTLSSVQGELYFWDDRGDNDLKQFTVFSGSNSDLYTIRLNPISYIQINTWNVQLNQPVTPFEIKAPKHLETGEIGGGGIYGTHIISVNKTFFFLTLPVLTDSSGEYVKDSVVTFFLNRGILISVQMNITKILLSGEVQKENTIIPFQVSLANLEIPYVLKCPITIGPSFQSSLFLRMNYTNLFKDNQGGFVSTIFTRGVPNIPFFIDENSHSDLKTIMENNLRNSDVFGERNCNVRN